MNVQDIFPLPREDNFKGWAAQMIVALQGIFRQIEPQLYPGTIVLWPDGISIPPIYLPCDGTEYSKSVSTALYKLLGESTPGMFETPNLTPPSGAVYVIRV